MFRELMKSKLHLAAVTEANLNYVGSISIDEDLMELGDLLPNEKVQVVNRNNGARLETYVIPAPRGSRAVCMNGPAARLAQTGDRIIIISYAWLEEAKARSHEPTVIVLDEENRPAGKAGSEVHGRVAT